MRTAVMFALLTMLHATQVRAEPPPPPPAPVPAPVAVPAENVSPPPSSAVSAPAVEPAPAAPSSSPAVVVLPPPPAGYVYVPQANQDSRRLALSDERLQIEQRLAQLKAERARYGIGGPIAMMGVGFGGAFVFAYVALVQYLVSSVDDGYDNDYQNADYRSDEEVRTGRTLLAISVLSLGLGITGSVLLGKRLHARNVFKPEMRSLKLRKRELDRDLRYSATVTPEGGMGLSLRGRF